MKPFKKKGLSPEAIDAVLPQTQCELCGYQGCLPYARAISEHKAQPDLCLPGGTDTLKTLANLLEIDPGPYLSSMRAKQKSASVALIDPNTCIGCTKCIQACPTDAIIGSSKSMHTVLPSECTGCDLCLEVCPVDCITVNPIEALTDSQAKKSQSDYFRKRYQHRKARLQKQHVQKQKDHLLQKKGSIKQNQATLAARQALIQDIVQKRKKTVKVYQP
jgi:Na+-translocating ferredoxin:NAD+ oxidoreductase subunit B